MGKLDLPSNAVTEDRVLSGRYRIVGHLARGGMGDVFEAEDLSLGRTVAIKVLHPNFASDEAFVSRFRREAQAAANLGHPNIVSIYDFGEDGSTYYMVMELIDGRTLRDVSRSEGPLLPRRAAEIVAEAAAALTVAHQAGVFHRDVKPGNIMLTGDGSVKVTDFGIARALDDSEELTRTGAVIGTATYFSPEQAQGLPADERSDIYSLGVVLYELLCGQPPFTGESPVAVAYQHVSEYAPPPSGINPDVPHGLEAVVEKAMEKRPDDRYQSAAELRNELLRWLRGEEPVVMTAPSATSAAMAETEMMQAPPPPATVTPDETARYVAAPGSAPTRTQASYIITIVGLIIALVVGVFVLIQLLQPPDEPTVALVTVPDVTGFHWEDALEDLQDENLKVRQQIQSSDTVPVDFVISTDPSAGEQIEPGQFVIVITSSGAEQFPIPVVIDLPLDAATSALEDNGFEVGTVTLVFSENVPIGNVVDQNPRPGQQAAPGTVVDLEVSDGPFALTMPNVVGTSEDAAIQTLNSARITNVVVEQEFSDEILEGFVIRSTPADGQLVGREEQVTIYVSQGPEPFAVPNLIGSTPDEAQQLADDLGFVLIFEEETVEVTDLGLDGRVAAQNPSDGEIRAGDEVRVRLGALKQVEVPELIGLTVEEATTLLADLGLTLEVAGETEVDPDSGLVGVIATQIPDSGSIPFGSAIQVTVGVEIVPPPPDPEPPPDE